jgi:putative flippase GtrA
MAVRGQLLAFTVVGTIGFLVDAATLHLAMGMLGTGLYLGRVISYLVAATTTWALNRRFTFHAQRSSVRVTEWGRFLIANAAGGLVNYGTYAALVATQPTVATHPVIGVAAGSLAGLALNFTLSRYLVFRGGPRS